ncbi:hypothetical protein J4465_00260 [Candidatus Pacearchaeota archaeon]|nr:hypothetical protein [Candidatus Pacearchaeota archaeon]
MAQKGKCDLCSACDNYPAICKYCHSPEKHYHRSSKKNNFYVELEFMLGDIRDPEIIKNTITHKISTDYLKVIIDNRNVSVIHYKDKLYDLCLKIFHIEYEHQLKSIKKELPKKAVCNEYTVDIIHQTAHAKAKEYLEITIINMINNAENNIKKKRRT